jgi:hypothetical protein
MTNAPDELKKSNAGSLARTIGIVAACISLLLPVSFALWRRQQAKLVDAGIKQIRAAALPASGADLNAWPARPDPAENGAVVLKEAFTLLREFPGKVPQYGLAGLFTNYWEPEKLAMLTDYVNTNRAALAKVEEGLKFKRFAYVTDYSPGLATLLPHLGRIKDVANILSAKTAVDSAHGDERAFVEDLRQIIQLAETLNDEHVIISWLIRTAVIQIAVRSAERVLSYRDISDDGCGKLEEAFASSASTNRLPAALAGERAIGLPIFKMSAKELEGYLDSSQGNQSDNFGHFGIGLASAMGVFDRDCRNYLEVMARSISLASLPPPESLALTNYIEQFQKTGLQRGTWLTTMLVSGLAKTTVKDATLRASVDCVRSALAVQRFRNSHKTWPASLQELGPDFKIPNDPFDGKPMRYRNLVNGFILYSIDADGNDDGGTQKPPNSYIPGKTFDLIFKVERP